MSDKHDPFAWTVYTKPSGWKKQAMWRKRNRWWLRPRARLILVWLDFKDWVCRLCV